MQKIPSLRLGGDLNMKMCQIKYPAVVTPYEGVSWKKPLVYGIYLVFGPSLKWLFFSLLYFLIPAVGLKTAGILN